MSSYVSEKQSFSISKRQPESLQPKKLQPARRPLCYENVNVIECGCGLGLTGKDNTLQLQNDTGSVYIGGLMDEKITQIVPTKIDGERDGPI